MRTLQIIGGLVLIAVLPFSVWYADIDDAPGLAGLGLLLALIGVGMVAKPWLDRRRHRQR